MPNYTVYMEGYAGFYARVDADNHEEAISKAYDEAPSGICFSCSGYGKNWGLDIGDEFTPSTVLNNETNEEIVVKDSE